MNELNDNKVVNLDEIRQSMEEKGLPASHVDTIIERCLRYGIDYNKNPDIFKLTVESVDEIVDVCRKAGIDYNSNTIVFMRRPQELAEVVEECKRNGIDYNNYILGRTGDEIRGIVLVCNEYGIDYHEMKSVFKKSVSELFDMAKLCGDNGVEISNSILATSFERLSENVAYIRDNYGKGYLYPMALIQDSERVREVFPYLAENGYLDSLYSSGALLTLPLAQLKERVGVVSALGEEVIVNGKANPIFMLSNGRYEDMYKGIIKTVRARVVNGDGNNNNLGGTKK